MRINTPVTNNEYAIAEDSALVSRTDLKGRITYLNPSFLKVSGFDLNELMGKAHNVIRHPDMPAQAFADMWDTLASNLPWTGLVKNRRKNGDFYWVQANVTPVRRQGVTQGYMSVRSKPTSAQVAEAERIYSSFRDGTSAGLKIWRGEMIKPAWQAPMASLRRIPITQRVIGSTALAAVLTLALGLMGWREMTQQALPAGTTAWIPTIFLGGILVSSLAWLGFGYFLVNALFRPLDAAAKVAQAIAGGDLAKFEIHAKDETKPLLQALNQMSANLLAVVADISASVESVASASGQIAAGNQDL